MGCTITVTVVANAKKNDMVVHGGVLRVHVKAKAQRGEANRELLKVLSSHFESPRILSGHTSKRKVISVENGAQEVMFILRELGEKTNFAGK